MQKPLLIVVAAALAILGSSLGGDAIWLHYVFKPLATILILLLAWRTAEPVSADYKRAVVTGLFMSLCGDVSLMLPKSVLGMGFELGLASFLVAHLFLLRAFTRDAALFSKRLPLIVLLVISIGNLAVLWPSISPALHIPVLAYMMCLVGMAAQSISRAMALGSADSRLAAVGGVFFLISDTTLAYNKFYASVPASSVLVLGTYYLALYLIARSVQRTKT